jgi:hypothetical protein
MATESHGSHVVSPDPPSRFFWRFLKIAILKDRRAAEFDIVKAMLGSIRKGETIMATRRMKSAVWGLTGTLLTLAWLIGFVTEVGAETMKLQVSNAVMKAERSPVGDVEGHALIFLMREGSMRLENGG